MPPFFCALLACEGPLPRYCGRDVLLEPFLQPEPLPVSEGGFATFALPAASASSSQSTSRTCAGGGEPGKHICAACAVSDHLSSGGFARCAACPRLSARSGDKSADRAAFAAADGPCCRCGPSPLTARPFAPDQLPHRPMRCPHRTALRRGRAR